MKEPYLRAAMIAGTIALFWIIPSLNVLGIIAYVLSWSAYSRSSGKSAANAMKLYIGAAAVSVPFAVLMLFLIMKIFQNRGLVIGAAAAAAVGVFLLILAAVMSGRGAKSLKNKGKDEDGFFE